MHWGILITPFLFLPQRLGHLSFRSLITSGVVWLWSFYWTTRAPQFTTCSWRSATHQRMTTYRAKTLHETTEAAKERTSDRRLECLNMRSSERRGDVVNRFISLAWSVRLATALNSMQAIARDHAQFTHPIPPPHTTQVMYQKLAAACILSCIKKENFFMRKRQPLYKTGSPIGFQGGWRGADAKERRPTGSWLVFSSSSGCAMPGLASCVRSISLRWLTNSMRWSFGSAPFKSQTISFELKSAWHRVPISFNNIQNIDKIPGDGWLFSEVYKPCTFRLCSGLSNLFAIEGQRLYMKI